MASTRSQQVITLAAVRSLNNKDSHEQRKPVIWKELGVYLDKKVDISTKPDSESSTRSSLIAGSIPDRSYLSTNIGYKICNSCNRPIGDKSLASHLTKCLEMKQRKEEGADKGTPSLKRKRGRANNLLDIEPSSVDSSRNSTPVPSTPNSMTNGVSKPKKKYKKSQTQKEKEAANAAAAAAAAAAGTSSKKESVGSVGKKKKQAKPKSTAKPKGPVDVEKQCGVPLPSGGFCARSLTCKTHSMGAKRAVMGRSAPYDVLLQQYQKRNQAKIAASNALAAQRRENAEFNGVGDSMSDDLNGSYNKILDPDEETNLVLEGLSKNNPIPLERKVLLPVRSRHRFLSTREFYANAFIISGNNNSNNASTANGGSSASQSAEQTLANQAISGSIGGLQGRCALINVDAPSSNSDSSTQSFSAIPGEMYQVRAPLKAIITTAQHNALQQQAFQQQVLKFQQQQQQQMLMKQKQARAAAAANANVSASLQQA
ncbi:SCA7-domain-containing protein [Suhomyces tanzawaensis NRRL Y-17324]|uniref:SCA7-domain-containing protein n=1 Tax=Suhomyces tanzawaensis NRRL Y-17324 TaxID=984487 RepID=A0A1E4SRA3_9ASCO|nr:SCA7-domain-containing protein [Suhomyces tanzawaensis NRRL Y-17324]ODV81932.1 SCA7-domain-containing protein [Suhomyces tanzawaensis NRRL Y-17324]